jgi:amino acid adenylation domain-containing protein
MWAALTTGGRVVVVPYLISRNAEMFYELVRDESVTVLSLTPSAFRQFETVDQQARSQLRLRAVVFGGEALDQPSVRRWAGRHGYANPVLINMYGITETTVHVTYLELSEGHLGRAVTQIGRPLADMQVHVLDSHGAVCPVGVPGEIHVGGEGLSRGYTGQPGITAGRFVPDHVSGAAGGRLYRSGDLGRWNAAGCLEYLGRADSQVKIRGYRIELGEIQAALASHPGVRECAVVARTDTGEQADLVAYLVPVTTAPSVGDVLLWLRQRLPDYMVPRSFVTVAALPLTAQGKTDVRALPAPEAIRPELDDEFAAPLPGLESVLAEIWARVLGVGRVGRHDNFFDLGGDSIRSIQVLGQARTAGVPFALQDLFRHPTVQGLAVAAASQGDSDGDGTRAGSAPFGLVNPGDLAQLPDDLADAYPMAELQVGMVYEMALDPDRRPYHNVDSLRITGPFDEARFREAVAKVVARHPVLRTSFDLSGYSEPMQLVHSSAEVPVTVADLRHATADEQDLVIAAYVSAERGSSFDHARPSLLRFGIHVRAPELFQWTITEHHAIFDGWSLHSTISEITAVYLQLLAGEDPALEQPASSYRDFIAAERSAIGSAQSEAFWAGKLSDLPDCRLPRWPADRQSQLTGDVLPGELHQRIPEQGYGALSTPLPPDLLASLVALAKRGAVPLKSVLVAAYLRMMSLVVGSDDIVTGLTANGRIEHPDGAEVRGMFLNTVPLRLRLPEGSWLDLIQAVFEAERELLPHRRYPLGALQRKLGGGPLFEVNFVYNHFHVLDSDSAVSIARAEASEPSGVARTNFPLVIAISRDPAGAGLRLEFEYDARELTQAQVTVIRDYYVRVLGAMVADPEGLHFGVVLLGEAELGLLGEWNDTAAVVGPGLVHELFEARVAAAPDAVAVVAGSVSLTYRELNARANRLAWFLRGLGVGPDVCVGLCVERSAELVVGLLGIVKAGGAYVPVDGGFPAERLEHMLRQVSAPVVLAHEATAALVPAGPWQVVSLDSVQMPADAASAENLPALAGPGNLCYVIFTSGSTGGPKGVMTVHGNVSELLGGGECLAVGEGDTLLQIAPVPFDNSTFELWAPLVGGGRLVLPPPVQYGPGDVARWVGEYDVTVLHATASLFALMAEHEPGLFDGLRRFLTGSETVSPRHAALILDRCPQLELVNCWGPTETTTFSVCGVYTGRTLPAGPLPLGRPLANTQVLVLDGHAMPAPAGTAGELYVAGPCLARGYMGQPAMTAGRFGPHPAGHGRRLFRTGDRGRWSVDGQVEFLGRTDDMVKVRGYRIELREVETAIESCDDVQQAKALVAPGPDGNSELRAYAARAAGRDLSPAALRSHLASLLPRYMLPSVITVLDTLPATANGKIDKAGLLALGRAPEIARADPRPPQTELQQQVAAIWMSTLQVEHVDLADNFLELGGNSLLAARMLALISDYLDIELPVTVLMNAADLERFCVNLAQIFADSGEPDADPGRILAKRAG